MIEVPKWSVIRPPRLQNSEIKAVSTMRSGPISSRVCCWKTRSIQNTYSWLFIDVFLKQNHTKPFDCLVLVWQKYYLNLIPCAALQQTNCHSSGFLFKSLLFQHLLDNKQPLLTSFTKMLKISFGCFMRLSPNVVLVNVLVLPELARKCPKVVLQERCKHPSRSMPNIRFYKVPNYWTINRR